MITNPEPTGYFKPAPPPNRSVVRSNRSIVTQTFHGPVGVITTSNAGLKIHLGNETPRDLAPVLAEIYSMKDLGPATWHEVIYHDETNWCGYYGGTRFDDGETVIKWVYVRDIF